MANKETQLDIEELETMSMDDLRQEEPDLYSVCANWHSEKDEAYEEFLDFLEKEGKFEHGEE